MKIATLRTTEMDLNGSVVEPLAERDIAEIRGWAVPVDREGGDAAPYYGRTASGRLIQVGFTLRGTPAARPVDMDGLLSVIWV